MSIIKTSKTIRPAIIAILTALVFICTGCGYSTAPLHPTNVATIYIPMPQSREFRRGLEYEFHAELVRMVLERTPYRLADRNQADTILVTRVIDLTESVMTLDEDNVPTETQVRLSVEYQWKNQRSGQVLVEGTAPFSWFYAPAEGQTLRSAQTTVISKLAERIVEEMESDW